MLIVENYGFDIVIVDLSLRSPSWIWQNAVKFVLIVFYWSLHPFNKFILLKLIYK